MKEETFWRELEYRVSRELAVLPGRRQQHFWCDGFFPSDFILDAESPRIGGRCWIGNGSTQAEWEFALFLTAPVRSRKEIDWAALLPPEDVTRWIAVNEQRRDLEIEPAVAVSDSATKPAK